MCPFRFASSCICSGQGYTLDRVYTWHKRTHSMGPRKCGTYCGLFAEHSNQKVPSLVQCGPRVLPSGHSIELYSLLASRRSDPSHLADPTPFSLTKESRSPTPPPAKASFSRPIVPRVTHPPRPLQGSTVLRLPASGLQALDCIPHHTVSEQPLAPHNPHTCAHDLMRHRVVEQVCPREQNITDQTSQPGQSQSPAT